MNKSERDKKYYLEHKEEIKARVKEYAAENSEKIKARSKIYREANKEQIVEYGKVYRELHADEIKKRRKVYRELNKEKISQQKKASNERHSDTIRAHSHAYYIEHKDEIYEKTRQYKNEHRDHINECERERLYALGKHRPMSENRECGIFLGVHVAERVLSHVFENVTRMPMCNPGYDFICKNGYKIDVKSSCLLDHGIKKSTQWRFNITKNVIADYFLLIAFDNRDDLNPMHVWLVPGNVVNMKGSVAISDVPKSLYRWQAYEKPIENVVTVCEEMKNGDI